MSQFNKWRPNNVMWDVEKRVNNNNKTMPSHFNISSFLTLVCVNVCVCSEAEKFVTKGSNRIGSRYKKVRYVEYTDNSFLTKMLRSPEEQHLGILGNLVHYFIHFFIHTFCDV